MLFNSYEFIIPFLPTVLIIYFMLVRFKFLHFSKLWLVGGSLYFYSWWNISYLPLILLSVMVNFFIGKKIALHLSSNRHPKILLVLGITFNLSLLGYFKYVDFFISNLNFFIKDDIGLLHIALPLAISFFTFQQIAYLVDSYKGETKRYKFLNYILFVTFFPQLIAGPIVNHKEMVPQFEDPGNKHIHYKNICIGLFIFFVGLFKKVVIADQFAIWATHGFTNAAHLSFIEAWTASLSYTFQLYFDFSGYSDMAIGAALLFNIQLPVNFNSPYKAINIQDFWGRWHMTLTRFLTRYVYIPLGGSRKGVRRTYFNIFLVFLLSGIWHGAGWTFIFWGILHGIAMMIQRFWSGLNLKMHKYLAWFITFQFVNFSWVFFRADNWQNAIDMLEGMLGLRGINVPSGVFGDVMLLLWLPVIFIGTVVVKNSIELSKTFQPNRKTALLLSVMIIYSLLQLDKLSEFLYFNF